MTRRHSLYLLSGSALAACSPSGSSEPRAADPSAAEAVVPGQGRWVQGPGIDRADLSGTFQGRPFTKDTPFRVASISKLLVAELARRLHQGGALDLDADVGPALGRTFVHPDHPNRPVTLRHLISHRSGIADPSVYWMASPGNIRDLLTDEIWEAGGEPGQSFRYSNLNYGIAATVMEVATNERFDLLFRRVVAEPLGLDIGFNWGGVSADKRASGFPGLRGTSGDWTVQVDGPDVLSGASNAYLSEEGWSLDDYEIGSNGTLFSPQGGLRASLSDLMVIGQKIVLPQTALHSPGWVWDGVVRDGGPSEDGHFIAFGEGVYIYPDVEPLGAPAVGHHGLAYGIYSGLWVMPETDTVFVHVDLGSPENGSPMTNRVPNLPAKAANAFDWLRS